MADQWAYTNAEHTAARKGRWAAKRIGINWALTHDDIPAYAYTPDGNLTKPRARTKPYYALRVAWYEQMRDFLAWHVAQPAPIAVGDYVRLTGEGWDNDEWPDAGTCWLVENVDSDGSILFTDNMGYTLNADPDEFTRITVTADLDEPWNLPMPEVGEWVWTFTTGSGYLFGRVTELRMTRGYLHVLTDSPCVELGWHSQSPTAEGVWKITAWGTYDPADLTPDEPTTFGPVGEVTNPEGHDCWILRADDGTYTAVAKHDGLHVFEGGKWPDVLALGTFTAVER